MIQHPEWVEPRYVDVGMNVVAPYKGSGLRCVVACAAGVHARVVNERRDFSEWFHIGELRVPREPAC